MVKIRLQRLGRKKRPEYRVVVMDERTRRDGRYIEAIGLYFPQQEQADLKLRIDNERASYWLGVGAQPSETVRGLLHQAGVLAGKAPSLGKPDQPNLKEERERQKAEKAAQLAKEAEEAAKAKAEAKAAEEAAEAEAAAAAEAEAKAAEAAAAAEAEAAQAAEAAAETTAAEEAPAAEAEAVAEAPAAEAPAADEAPAAEAEAEKAE